MSKIVLMEGLHYGREKKEDGFAYGAIFIGMPEMEASRIQLYDTINNLTQAK